MRLCIELCKQLDRIMTDIHSKCGSLLNLTAEKECTLSTISILQYYLPYYRGNAQESVEDSGRRIKHQYVLGLIVLLVELHDEHQAEAFLDWFIVLFKKSKKKIDNVDAFFDLVNRAFTEMYL